MKDGWYVYKPCKNIVQINSHVSALVGCGKQVVQVIEGELWLTGVTNTYTVEEAMSWGKFVRRLKL
jgi:hypothetical protein